MTGGLAGIYFGIEGIQKEWLAVLVKKNEIEELAKKFELKILLKN